MGFLTERLRGNTIRGNRAESRQEGNLPLRGVHLRMYIYIYMNVFVCVSVDLINMLHDILLEAEEPEDEEEPEDLNLMEIKKMMMVMNMIVMMVHPPAQTGAKSLLHPLCSAWVSAVTLESHKVEDLHLGTSVFQ